MSAPAHAAPAPPATLAWDGRALTILDQTLLPAREQTLTLHGARDTADAIRRLAIRGAGWIGVAGAYGLAMEVARDPTLGGLERGWAELRGARPTAVNLAWAVDRVRAAALAAGPAGMAGATRAEAETIERREIAASATMGHAGADRLAGVRRVMTHCNAGALAVPGEGSALAVVFELARRGPLTTLACEARPLLQGARLTVWELARAGLDHELCVDAAAAGLIARGEVDAVVVGMDRAAANGDVANKVGTYGLALAAHAAGIPFLVVGPTSTVDLAIPNGAGITIEERDADEVRAFGGTGGSLVTVRGTRCRNPAFDVTPAALVTALVTERGIAEPVGPESVAALVET